MMVELRDLIGVLRRAGMLIILGCFAGSLLGFSWAMRAAADPRTTAVVSVRFEGLGSVSEDSVRYDGYYVVETERRFGVLLAEALRSASLREAARSEAGMALSRAERITDFDYRVEFRGRTASDPQAREQFAAVSARAFEELRSATGEALGASVAATGWSPSATFSPSLAAAVGALAGFILSAFWALFREYFASHES